MGLPSGWQTPKTNWNYYDFLDPTSLNRIENNLQAIELGLRGINQYKSLSSSNVSLTDFVDYVATLIRLITGETNWIDSPQITLKTLNQLTSIDNLDFCRMFLYHALVDYDKYIDLDVYESITSNKFSGLALARGTIVFIPKSLSYALTFNPATNTTGVINVSGGTDYWRGGAGYNGKIYCAPYNSDKILIIDIKTNGVSYLTIPDVGATSGRFWGAIERNGKVYFIPHNATKVLVLDTSNNSMYTLGSLTGTAQYAGGALAKGIIYCAPYDSTSILKIASDDTLTTVGSISGSAKYVGAAASLDQTYVYFAPYNATNILCLNVDSIATTTVPVQVTSGAFWGITVLPNGKFLLIPHNNSSALYFVPPSTVQEITISSDTNKFCGGIVWLDGKVYMAPCNYSKIGSVYGVQYVVFDHQT